MKGSSMFSNHGRISLSSHHGNLFFSSISTTGSSFLMGILYNNIVTLNSKYAFLKYESIFQNSVKELCFQCYEKGDVFCSV